MDRIEIEGRLKEKYNDEYTVQMFTTFVLEFQECFSDIMDTEELIDRIKKNVFGNIRIVEKFDNVNLDGRYAEDGYIYLKKSVIEDERYVRYLLFHEMLHAVTSIRDESGKGIMMGFSYLANCYGMGLNEAMTEYLTQIRNEKFETDYSDLISGYRTIVEQIRRLISIIGDKELIRCYFHNPDSLKELLNANKMNYDELELAYRKLCGKDEAVNSIGFGRKLEDREDYKIHRFSEMIFNNYANAIGEIETVEDFLKKYKIFQTYVDGGYDCIITMMISYYNSIGKDIDRLLAKGISFDEIKPALTLLKIDLRILLPMYQFSKCFVDDKNKSAVEIYEFYQRRPNQYMAIFRQNYGKILDHFTECDVNPAEGKLYDELIYPFIGLLLKEHPEIDYSDVSYDKIEEENSGDTIFIFSSSNGEKYAYRKNGGSVTQYCDEKGNQIFKYRVNDKCTCSFIFGKDDTISYHFNSSNDFDLEEFMKNIRLTFNHYSSEKEDIENWIENGWDEDGSFEEKLKQIQKRVQNRQAQIMQE